MSNVFVDNSINFWATGGCGSRGGYSFIANALDEVPRTYHSRAEPVTYTMGQFEHAQYVPSEFSHFDIVCCIRNPYTRMISGWLNVVKDGRSDLDSFDDYVFNSHYTKYADSDSHYFKFKTGYLPTYVIRMENQVEDFLKIPQLQQAKETNPDRWEQLEIRHYKDGNWTGKNENILDKYDSNGHQITNIYFSEETANYVYEQEKIIFDMGEYNKDSWK